MAQAKLYVFVVMECLCLFINLMNKILYLCMSCKVVLDGLGYRLIWILRIERNEFELERVV